MPPTSIVLALLLLSEVVAIVLAVPAERIFLEVRRVGRSVVDASISTPVDGTSFPFIFPPDRVTEEE